jgi:hypothetical protein
VPPGAEVLRPVADALKAARQRAPVLHSAETGVAGKRRAGQLAWAHVSGTHRLTQYAIHAQRSQEATDAIGILPGSRGVRVHDGAKPSRRYTACRHARWNLHHWRKLTCVEEPDQQPWAKELTGLLLAMQAAVAQARSRVDQQLPAAVRWAFVAHAADLLTAGRAATPPPPPERPPGQRGRVKHSPAGNLLARLRQSCSAGW